MIPRKYQEIPFIYQLSLFPTTRASRASSSSVYLLPLTMQIWYSAHKTCQWLTASVADVSQWKPNTLIAHMCQCCWESRNFRETTNINNFELEVQSLVIPGVLRIFSTLALIQNLSANTNVIFLKRKIHIYELKRNMNLFLPNLPVFVERRPVDVCRCSCASKILRVKKVRIHTRRGRS